MAQQATSDDRLAEATVAVLGEVGWDGLSLERVAARAGVSRVTLWRQGVTRETLVAGLLRRLADDYREAMWPVLAAEATGRERLEGALLALFDVLDRHLPLLLVSDEVFHWAAAHASPPGLFLDPFLRALADGQSDGSLGSLGRPDDAADVLFNTACWPYVHLRGRHRWSARRARELLLAVMLEGAAAR
jgi:AcrR family transcriptional regulator